MFRTLTACTASAALLFATSGVAQAHDSNSPASEVADAIAAVAPDVGKVVEASQSGGAFAARSGETMVTIPEDAGAPVTIRSADEDEAGLTVKLPGLLSTGDARQAEDGTLVYTSDDDASLAIQPLAEGATRFLSVLENGSAPERYDYTFEGIELQLLNDGSVLAIDGDKVVGSIAAAWAFDASGTPVPTHYEVDGPTLTQVVSHNSETHVYPVTADPTLSFGWRIYWTLSASDQRYLTVAGAAGGGGALCSATGALACGVATAAAAVVIQWINERGSICKAPKSRLQVGIPYGWPTQSWPGVAMSCIK